MPRHCLAPFVGCINEDDCHPSFDGPFDEVLHNICTAGTDGGRDTDKQMTTTRVSAGAAIYNEQHDKFACMSAPVPGLQTIPRAETWSFLQSLLRLTPGRLFQISVDAKYVVDGALNYSEHLWSKRRPVDESVRSISCNHC